MHFVSSNSELYSASITTVWYQISCYIGPHNDVIWLYNDVACSALQTKLRLEHCWNTKTEMSSFWLQNFALKLIISTTTNATTDENFLKRTKIPFQWDFGLTEAPHIPSGQVHDDVIKWRHFPRNWPLVWWIPLTKVSGAELWCFLWSAAE